MFIAMATHFFFFLPSEILEFTSRYTRVLYIYCNDEKCEEQQNKLQKRNVLCD